MKALGRAVRQKLPITSQMPLDMQMALLCLAVSEREPGTEHAGLQASRELTEQDDHEDGYAPKEARFAGSEAG
jgi:hypothetical protein